MTEDGTSSGDVTLGDPDVGRSIETESRYRRVGKQVASRWKMWAVIAVTALTALGLFNIDEGWSTDVTAFVVITVVLLGYTLVTLYTDLKIE